MLACGAASNPLSLAVTVRPAGADENGGDRIAEFTIRNTGRQRLWVNTRLHMNGYRPPDPFQEISVSVTGPDGSGVPWSCRLRVRLANAEDYRALEPGEEARVTDPMFGRCFVLKPGTYRVCASYQDGNDNPPPAPPGAVYFPGPVASQATEVTISSSR